jgi:hydroxyethylthiazole kinase-like uncharacterized protein yjeF
MDIMVLDENAEYLGVPRDKLMENAGATVARVAKRFIRDKDGYVCIIAGLGNNGGDGFVAARHLSRYTDVKVLLLGEAKDIRTEESRRNYEALTKLNMSVEIIETPSIQDIKSNIDSSVLIIDAILGTGVKGELREPIRTIVKMINESGKPIVSIDTPTGLNPTTGEIHGEAVKAYATITFHGYKKGFLKRRVYTGEIIVEDIGIPLEAELYVGPGDWKALNKSMYKKVEKIKLVTNMPIAKQELCSEIISFINELDIELIISRDAKDVYDSDIIYLTMDAVEDYLKDKTRLKRISAIKVDNMETAKKLFNRGIAGIYVITKSNVRISMNIRKLRSRFEKLVSIPPYEKIILAKDGLLIIFRDTIKLSPLLEDGLDGWICSSLIAKLLSSQDIYSFTGCLWRYIK